MKLTAIIKKYCKEKGTCPSRVAVEANIDRGHVSRLMNGKLQNRMGFFAVLRLLKVCEVPASEVYNVEPE